MQSVFGENIKISLFGESHGECVGVTIDGLAPGLFLDLNFIKAQLLKRSLSGAMSTSRKETDEFKIVSGFFNGFTTGTPLTIIISNMDTRSEDYESSKDLLRPGHADFTAYEKYLGYQDYRGGGHFSGRITAPLVAAGAIFIQVLAQNGIKIGTRIKSIHNVIDEDLNIKEISKFIDEWNNSDFPTYSASSKVSMQNEIAEAKENSDSVGGVLESYVINMPTGIGEPFFDSIESKVSSLLFCVPSVKGVEFGLGFGFSNKRGSEVSDAFAIENSKIVTKTNNNGGINGGVTNGMPIVVRCVVKPTASIGIAQESLNYSTQEEIKLMVNGRHDPCIVHRARVVVDSMIAIALVDLFVERYGYMWMRNK